MNGKAIAGLILGIVALVCSVLGGFIIAWCYVIALPIAIVGLVLSIVGGNALKAAGQPTGMATAGLVIGIIATVFGAITFFTCGICVICFTAAEEATKDALENIGNELYNLVK